MFYCRKLENSGKQKIKETPITPFVITFSFMLFLKFMLIYIDIWASFPCGLVGKESTFNAGGLGWEEPLEKGKATQLQYSGLEKSMDSIVHGVAESVTSE